MSWGMLLFVVILVFLAVYLAAVFEERPARKSRKRASDGRSGREDRGDIIANTVDNLNHATNIVDYYQDNVDRSVRTGEGGSSSTSSDGCGGEGSGGGGGEGGGSGGGGGGGEGGGGGG